MPESPAETVRLSGTIERVTFHSPETGFAVLRVSTPGHRGLATVVGHMAEARAGEYIEAAGGWIVDSEYGRQFKAERIRATHPASEEGIRKYLASGLVQGIGPHLAEKLVEAFGTDVFKVIEESPDRLREVDGIGGGRQERIVEGWREQSVVRDIMVFLQGHGLGTARAIRIFKTYGDEAIGVVKDNPYRLAHDVRGIGFQVADELAGQLGVPRDSPLRARAGAGFVLRELTTEGHCAFPFEELVERVRLLLDVDTLLVEEAIAHEVRQGVLVSEQVGDTDWIYLAALYAAEVGVATRAAELLSGKPPLPAIDVGVALQWLEQQIGFELAEGQRAAIAMATRSKVVVITGGPGVGKTTIVDSILRIFRAKKMACVLAAPTGRAAKRLTEATRWPARTLHRLLEFDPVDHGFRRNAENRLEGDLFLIDEVSMMDVPMAFSLLQAVPNHAAVILVGDVDQLPSVGPGTVLRDVIDSGVVPTARLTEIFRQAAESRIVVSAHEVNRGAVPDLTPAPPTAGEPDDFFFVPAEDPEEALQRLVRVVTERIPERFGLDPMRDVQVLSPMHRGVLGVQNLNRVLQSTLNPSRGQPSVERSGYRFAVGDKVLQTENDYGKDVFNGDLGIIAAMNTDDTTISVDFDGRRVEYDFTELDELLPAYAMTIHKSQGSEFPAVVIPVHTQHYIMLQRNLLYTALTRARSLVVMVGTPRAVAIAARTATAKRRCTALRERLINAGIL